MLHMKRMAFAQKVSKNAIRAQAGKVRNHPKNNSAATFGLVERFLQRPTPIIAQVFACVVAVGIPKNEQTPKIAEDAVSAAELDSGSRSASSHPTFFIIFVPPIIVPNVIAAATLKVSKRGIWKSLPGFLMNDRPSRYTPINF